MRRAVEDLPIPDFERRRHTGPNRLRHRVDLPARTNGDAVDFDLDKEFRCIEDPLGQCGAGAAEDHTKAPRIYVDTESFTVEISISRIIEEAKRHLNVGGRHRIAIELENPAVWNAPRGRSTSSGEDRAPERKDDDKRQECKPALGHCVLQALISKTKPMVQTRPIGPKRSRFQSAILPLDKRVTAPFFHGSGRFSHKSRESTALKSPPGSRAAGLPSSRAGRPNRQPPTFRRVANANLAMTLALLRRPSSALWC